MSVTSLRTLGDGPLRESVRRNGTDGAAPGSSMTWTVTSSGCDTARSVIELTTSSVPEPVNS